MSENSDVTSEVSDDLGAPSLTQRVARNVRCTTSMAWARLHSMLNADGFHSSARALTLPRLVRVRLWVAPFAACFAALLAFAEPTPWRRVVVAVVVLTMLALTSAEFVRLRRFGSGAISLRINLYVMVACQLAIVFATGGLFSAFFPVVLVASFVGVVLSEGGVDGRRLPWIIIPAVWTMAVLHHEVGLVPAAFGLVGSFETGASPWFAAVVYSVLSIAVVRVGQVVREALERLFREAIAERDERLALHREQSRTLSALSAEIAHELKNPLASVKGLSALVSRELSGKAEERMTVLRGEVDRMQVVLDEFLNLSRPLVPLNMEEVDVSTIVDDVLRLNEGSAKDHGVTLLARSSKTTVSCDPRKVRQILVNLVQNALESSGEGGEVEVLVDTDENATTIAVADRGGGVDPTVAADLFEAGVTTKAGGSGIGLAVARSLARQHEGDVSLQPRVGGGCTATLKLPSVVGVES